MVWVCQSNNSPFISTREMKRYDSPQKNLIFPVKGEGYQEIVGWLTTIIKAVENNNCYLQCQIYVVIYITNSEVITIGSCPFIFHEILRIRTPLHSLLCPILFDSIYQQFYILFFLQAHVTDISNKVMQCRLMFSIIIFSNESTLSMIGINIVKVFI